MLFSKKSKTNVPKTNVPKTNVPKKKVPKKKVLKKKVLKKKVKKAVTIEPPSELATVKPASEPRDRQQQFRDTAKELLDHVNRELEGKRGDEHFPLLDAGYVNCVISAIRSQLEEMSKIQGIGFYDPNTITHFTNVMIMLRMGESLKDSDLDAAAECLNHNSDILFKLFGHVISDEMLAVRNLLYWHNGYFNGTLQTVNEDFVCFLEIRDEEIAYQTESLWRTGMLNLDAALSGGGRLTILAAQAGVGKSSLALHIADESLRADPKLCVLYCSLDQPKKDVYGRLLCRFLKSSSRNLESKTERDIRDEFTEEDRDVLKRMRVIDELRPKVIETSDSDNVVSETAAACIIRTAHELANHLSLNKVMVVVDYLQLLADESKAPSQLAPERSQDARLIGNLNELRNRVGGTAETIDMSVIVISELRKQEFKKPKPDISDLIGSTRLGYASDLVLLMSPVTASPTAASKGTSNLVIDIAKGRDGVERGDHHVTFDYGRYIFAERERVVAKKAVARSAKTGNVSATLKPKEKANVR